MPGQQRSNAEFWDDAVLSEISRELTPRQALHTRAFWYIFLAYAVTGIPLQGILGHIIIWGVEAGVAPADSGLIMAMMTLPSIPVCFSWFVRIPSGSALKH